MILPSGVTTLPSPSPSASAHKTRFKAALVDVILTSPVLAELFAAPLTVPVALKVNVRSFTPVYSMLSLISISYSVDPLIPV